MQGALHLDVAGRPVRLNPGQAAVIGRSHECDIFVDNGDVSRRHAQVYSEHGRWFISDLGSSNGTLVGGTRIGAPTPLQPGSVVTVGGVQGVTIRVGTTPIAAERGNEPTSATRDMNHAATSQLPPTGTPSTPPNLNAQWSNTAGRESAHNAPAGRETAGRTTRPQKTSDTTGVTGPVRLPKPKARVPEQVRHVGEIFDSFDASQAHANVERGTVVGALPQVMPQSSGTITIGRGLENEIVLRDLLASRRHAQLTPATGGFQVRDLGSRNGTFINGSRVSTGLLREGDLLTVGRARFTIKHGALVASQDEGNVNFVANHLSFTLPDGKKLLDDISFGLDGSSLVAVIGPSGAGKSTLLKALIGAQKATEGDVFYDGRDLYANYDDLRQRIGVVPQDDVVHHQLTVRQALRYAAELRFPDDLPKADREQRVEEVIEELGLANHAETQVARLSGGQRKRTSVALELLTEPSLLFLDEPTSGLDPGLDKRVMLTLRSLADGGRTVVVITHNVASLGVCDRVLLLAPGGKVAFFGPPDEMLPYFQAADHADIFNMVSDNPVGTQQAFAHSQLMESHVAGPLSAPRPVAAAVDTNETKYRQQSIFRQLSTLVRRQLRAVAADRGFMAFSLILPIVLGALIMLVPGEHGFNVVPLGPGLTNQTETQMVMMLVTMGAVFMGLAMTIRELVAERPIFLREKAVGLSPFAYLFSKVSSGGIFLLIQSLIMVGITVAVKHSPPNPVVLGNGFLELLVITFITAMASLALGLALSAFAKTSEQVMPMLVISVMAALVFSGGMFALEGALGWLAPISPSRWSLAMNIQTANTYLAMVNPRVEPVGQFADKYWKPDSGRWIASAMFMGVQFIVFFLIAWVATKRRKSM